MDIIFDNRNFLPVYQNDLMNARREIVIVSPFITKRRMLQMLPVMRTALERGVKVVVITRPASDFKESQALEQLLDLIQEAGITLVYKSSIHQKFAVFDQLIIWYGSINLLSFGHSEESIMRLESLNIANELMRSLIND
jgi:phosphatidylserine/phosphatidylglycerophosphate/cardiolipin synthase-like enzyme